MKRLLICCLLLGLTSLVCAAPAALLDPGADRLLQRTVVPSREQPQGEVQLLRRGQAQVVRVLLASKVLKRVVATIDAKEAQRWPQELPQYIASDRYRDELLEATEQAWTRFLARADRDERRQFLLIEFIQDAGKGWISLALPEITGDYGQLRLIGQQPVKFWRSDAEYVRENMITIIQYNFQLERDAAQALLAETTDQKE